MSTSHTPGPWFKSDSPASHGPNGEPRMSAHSEFMTKHAKALGLLASYAMEDDVTFDRLAPILIATNRAELANARGCLIQFLACHHFIDELYEALASGE